MQEQKVVTINTPYIELDKLLKREDLAASGGEARWYISEGLVLVNGDVEMRKRKKIYPGYTVVFENTVLVVKEKGL